MSRDRDKIMKALSRPQANDYDVGYGKPPAASHFKPGQSGNPHGRPRGAKNRPSKVETTFKDIVLMEARRPITITDTKGPITVPMAQAIMRTLAVNAAKGRIGAQRLITELLTTIERDDRRMEAELFGSAVG